MASHAAEAAAAPLSIADDTPVSAPVELSALPSSSLERALHPTDQVDPTTPIAQTSADEALPPSSTPAVIEAPSTSQPQHTSEPAPAPLTRKQTEALGPATEAPIAPPASTGPVLSITLMLTTGARHPYKIDEKYLRNRNCQALASDGTFDPRELNGYKLKELIWTDWRNEWEPRPAAPSSIRLIIWGKMLDDKKMLSDYNFNLDTTNVVHMTIKPADFGEDDEGAGGKHAGKGGSIRARDGGEGGAGCRCVVSVQQGGDRWLTFRIRKCPTTGFVEREVVTSESMTQQMPENTAMRRLRDGKEIWMCPVDRCGAQFEVGVSRSSA
ncbi:hypothetical protein LTR36_005433 [Oleoguttula mirabilis]|uniref:UBL3-like ubiquitin domain-containing protein n=1 Tax=Oleoguttula mirabilis TaxID=1507867 RepID=A0AAV9JF56_9PEZI|nr:hypothetical protein LTR36_005433 [Oleoguttula mirabilis]